MDTHQFVADIAISFTHVLEKKDIEPLINVITRIGGIKSISIPSDSNTVYVDTIGEKIEDIASKIEDLRKIEDIQNIKYQAHRRVTRSIYENSIVWAAREELKNSNKLEVEKLDNDDFKVISSQGGEITVKGTTVVVNNNKGIVNLNIESRESDLLETRRDVTKEVDSTHSASKGEKVRQWFQIGSPVVVKVLELLDKVFKF